MADVRVAGESSKQEAVWPFYGNDLENVGAKDKLPGRKADKMYQEDRKHQGLCNLKEPEAGSPDAPGMLRQGPPPDPKRDDMLPPGQPGSPLVTRGRETERVKATCSGASWSPEAGTLSAGTSWLGSCALPPRPAPQGPQLSRAAFRLWRAVGEGRPETKHPQTRPPCPGQGPAQPCCPPHRRAGVAALRQETSVGTWEGCRRQLGRPEIHSGQHARGLAPGGHESLSGEKGGALNDLAWTPGLVLQVQTAPL